jgi:riboflavin kinase / FMN adenylyltransferase
MTFPAQFTGLDNIALPSQPLHLAIGIFDGVHRGHRAVIEAAVAVARKSTGVSGVLTFWPHPSAVFRPENPTRLMHDLPSKTRVLRSLGVDVVITQPFTPELACVAAEEFLPWLKQRLPSLAAIYVGENFRFGRGRRGDVALLTASAPRYGLAVFSAPRVTFDGAPVSSTRVRAQLEAGEIDAVNSLLGYNYFSTGQVVSGKRLGRTIGFPTLNLPWSPDLRPRLGVYAVRVSASDGKKLFPGVANYGLRPTVENAQEPRLEVHLLEECPFTSGDEIVVEWLRFLRPETKFANVEELRAQIAQDREMAAEFFTRTNR